MKTQQGAFMKRIGFVLPALLGLAGCDNGTQGADTTAEQAAVGGDLAANSSVAPAPRPPGATDTPAPTDIPAAFRGRWALGPGGCTSGSDTLLTIGADKLEFYESVGTLDTIMDAEATRLRADFDFEGEGMNWEREIVLDLEDGGETLVRREFGGDAAPGSFRYTRC